MPIPTPTPESLTALRQERDRAMAASISANRRIQVLEAALLEAERSADRRQLDHAAGIREQLDRAAEDAKAARDRHSRFSDAARAGLAEWLQQTPQQMVDRLPDRDPFLLFPVRLETRFGRTPAGTAELRVRIWPDDIAIALPPGDLTAAEVEVGRQYWGARAIAATTPAGSPQADAARRQYEGAWEAIARSSGAYRAGWIVRQTKPSWDDARNVPAVMPLVFSPAAEGDEPRIAHADVLPDRFVIVGSFDDKAFPEVVGAPIPDDLALAPDPAQGAAWVERDAAGVLQVAEPLRWMVDFDAAVSVGMGMRIPLPAPWDTTGFDLLMAIGVRGATSAMDGVKRVEGLLAKHRFDGGCGIVRNGTPTNNTDSAVSGWKPPSTESDQLFAMEDQPAVLTAGPLGETDGHRLARLLGLSEAFVRTLPNATATDIAEALAMNRAASFGTVFEFVKEQLTPLVARLTRQQLRSFFHRNVSGRGVLPAIRVGRQPYGIVVTSDWNRWTIPARAVVSIEQKLLALLQAHRVTFQRLATAPPVTGTGTGAGGAKPFADLLHLVGQLASSAQYLSRKAGTTAEVAEHLAFVGASKEAKDKLEQELSNQLSQRVGEILTVAEQPHADLSSVIFMQGTDPWRGPIIDRDPKVPLSESAPVGPYNGTENYLSWLAHANLADLTTERMAGVDGATVAPPTALLYVLLRYALLTAVEEGTLEVAAEAGAKFFDVIERDPLIANIGQSQNVLRRDYLTVDAAQLGLTAKTTPLASWVHETARAVPGGILVASALAVVTDANEAIAALADVPTARLERLLAEHIDLCSYRVDAWVTAFYSQRLELLRSAQQQPGIYIGAYGWVENLTPNWQSRTPVDKDALPLSLRERAVGPVFQSTDNGGFVHAPSLQQACTAAVLRNAYLSHASPKERDLLGVNLSSARVRVAQTYIEGIRNGQSLAALLGYELERGLHERHPDLELDQYRYVLRDLFPFLAGKLTAFQVGVNAEVVEARNVVNGLDLLEYTAQRRYPYELAGLAEPGSDEANAIVAEIDRMRDGLDAVSDLLLAESVHQAVGGNLERTKASLQALTDPEAAPDPEVIRTPRSARLLKFRVTLALDAVSAAMWPGTPTPRARANPAVNAWLVQHLPAPSEITWSVKNGAGAVQLDSVASLPLQPIDLVLLAGDQLGQLSSELERLIVRRFRDANGVADDVRTRVAPLSGAVEDVPPLVFDFQASAGGQHGLASVHPLLLRLRRLISRSRAMHALDWLPSSELSRVDPVDPSGSAPIGVAPLADLKDLNDRLDAGAAALQVVEGDLQVALAALTPSKPLLDAVKAVLFEAHAYGMPEALPAEGETASESQTATLGAQAQVVLTLIAKRLAASGTLRAPFVDPLPTTEPELTVEKARRTRVSLERATDAARALFGTAFVIVPLFQFHQPAQTAELNLAAAEPAIADALVVEEWLHSVARVRPAIADLAWSMAVAEWMGARMADPLVIQLPRRAGVPWIGGEFGAALPEGEWLAVVALNSAGSFSGLQCGLVLDDWTENVPAEDATTGVAFHFNRPNATAPQALLLAVPPVLRGNWQWEELKGCVREALELAKLACAAARFVDDEPILSGPAGDPARVQSQPAGANESHRTICHGRGKGDLRRGHGRRTSTGKHLCAGTGASQANSADAGLEPVGGAAQPPGLREKPAGRGSRSAVVLDAAVAVRRVPGRGCSVADRCGARRAIDAAGRASHRVGGCAVRPGGAGGDAGGA
jgi:hypothetical protein